LYDWVIRGSKVRLKSVGIAETSPRRLFMVSSGSIIQYETRNGMPRRCNAKEPKMTAPVRKALIGALAAWTFGAGVTMIPTPSLAQVWRGGWHGGYRGGWGG
jgi:hypothetical protein